MIRTSDTESAPDSLSAFLRRRAVALAVVLSTAAALFFQLMVPPIVGLSNNGDFEKIMGIVGLEYPAGTSERGKHFHYATTRLAFGRRAWWPNGYRTSETLLVRLMMVPARAFGGGRYFDIRWIGGAHATLFVLFLAVIGIALARSLGGAGIVALLAGAFFFSDVGYVGPMNTLYGQEASCVSLFGIVAVLAAAFARKRFTPLLAAGYLASSVFFMTSKPQEAPQAAVLAAGALWFGLPSGGRARALGVLMAAALLGVGFVYSRAISVQMVRESLRQAVFDEVLRYSPDPRRDLREIGLDPALADDSARSLAIDAAREERSLVRLDYSTLVRFYLTHPGRTASILARTARAAMVIRPPAFGDLPESAAKRPRARSQRFSTWSHARAKAAAAGPYLLALIFGGAFGLALHSVRHGDPGSVLGGKIVILLVALGVVDFGVCALLNSHVEIERHLYVFDAITDTLLAIGLAKGWTVLGERLRARRFGGQEQRINGSFPLPPSNTLHAESA